MIDKAARIPAEVWQRNIRPTLSDHQGWGVFISTPHGRNWFFDQHTRGMAGDDPNYASWTFESRSNPYFPAEEWEQARATLPEDVFRQEYMAEFLEDSAGAFRGIEQCLRAGPARRSANGVAIGCDLAKYTDWTVLVAMDRGTGDCLEMDRFNNLNWPVQKDRIAAFCGRWPGAEVVPDATGAGDPIFDDLAPRIPGLVPFKFSNASKAELVQRLGVEIEQRMVSWPAEWTILTDELKRYEYALTAGGRYTYDAPSGFHDDCVIALALAYSRRTQPGLALPLPRKFKTPQPGRRMWARTVLALP